MFDLVVIGAGPAGLVAAAGAAGLGAKVALIERGEPGGDCLNDGCVPSKALIASARAAADARAAARLGVRATVRVDFAAVQARMERVRNQLAAHDSRARFRSMGVETIEGHARFVAADAIEVAGRRVRFRRAIVATGTRPAIPSIPGLSRVAYHTNESIFGIPRLPDHLVIVGGGPIGCELAQAFVRFGSRVTLVQKGPRLLAHDDADAATLLAQVLGREGVRVVLDASIAGVAPAPGGFRLDLGGEQVAGDALLLAAGRRPAVADLGLEAAGIRFDIQRGIETDAYLRTTNPRVFAAGDVCGRERFTHAADAHARIAVQNALFFRWATVSGLSVPWCTFTDPEIAHVGLTPGQQEVDTLEARVTETDRAILDGETDGFLKVHLAPGTDRILGATLVGRHAGETIGELALAISAGTGLTALAQTIHPYPTQAELLRKVALAYERRRLTPARRRLLGWWFGLKRRFAWPSVSNLPAYRPR